MKLMDYLMAHTVIGYDASNILAKKVSHKYKMNHIYKKGLRV